MAIDLANVAAGSGGFVIHGQDAGDKSGYSVSSAGDVNGDGFDDLIIGARR
jgi:FG-GAP repeat